MENKRILIVEDEKRMREIYSRLLRAVGVEVVEAADAWEATEVLIREKVDLVLLDLRMAEVDGKEMFEVIQELNPDLKIIISSVYSIDKQKKMVPSAQDYFDKSQGSFILLEKIHSVLGMN